MIGDQHQILVPRQYCIKGKLLIKFLRSIICLYKNILRSSLQEVMAELQTMNLIGINIGLDLVISNLRKSLGFKGYLIEPNLVRHTGFKSTMGAEHEQDRDMGDMREFFTNYPI